MFPIIRRSSRIRSAPAHSPIFRTTNSAPASSAASRLSAPRTRTSHATRSPNGGAASGLIFIEAPAGQGDIQFGRFDFAEEPVMDGFHGYAFYPDVRMTPADAGEGALGGDVFVDDTAPNRMWLMLHEIGHALGFKHPHQGDPTLNPSVDDQDHTVMSYNGDEPGVLGPFDHDAVEYLYDDPGSDGTHVAAWSWDASTATLTQTGTAHADTIRGVYGRDIISGGGRSDLILGSFGDDVLAGDIGADFLFGWDDDDLLRGGRGRDLLDGGAGSDTFRFRDAIESTGADHDLIVGFDPSNADTIDITGRLHSIESTIAGGHLSKATFDTDLEAAIGGPQLHKRAAVLFLPDSGTFAGDTFLIIEANKDSGYQAGGDLVTRLVDAVNLGSLDLSDFI